MIILNVLLVDDQTEKLNSLKEQIEKSSTVRFNVSGFENPYHAYLHCLNNPGRIDFAFIDYKLTCKRPVDCPEEVPTINSGVELTRALSKRNLGISIILYSGNDTVTEEDKWEGLAAGADSYISIKDDVAATSLKFTSEVQEFREMKKALEDFHEHQAANHILQQSVKVGISLIDKRFKIRFRNEDSNLILGSFRNNHQFCCSIYHGRDWPYCKGCLVKKALCLTKAKWQAKGEQVDLTRIGYSPVCIKGIKQFKYLHTWVKPIYSDKIGEYPIAALESIIDLTNSPTIEQMGLDENLDILFTSIAQLTCYWLEPNRIALNQIGQCKDFIENEQRHGYTRVRLYKVESVGRKSIMRLFKASANHDDIELGNFQIEFKKRPKLPRNLKGSRALYLDSNYTEEHLDTLPPNTALGCRENPVEFALFSDKGNCIGWLSVDSHNTSETDRKLGNKDAELLQDYANEISRIFQNKTDHDQKATADINMVLEDIELKIVSANSTNEALQIVVDELVGKCEINMGHIRLMEKKELIMIAGKGGYSKKAVQEMHIDTPGPVSRIVALTGLALFINNQQDIRIENSFKCMPRGAKSLMKEMQSYAFLPLKAFGKVEGVLALQSSVENTFTRKTIPVFMRIAEIASYVIHDISLQKEAEKKTAQIWQTASALSFAHIINNILPNAELRLDFIISNPSVTERVKEDAKLAKKQIQRAKHIAGEFKDFSKRSFSFQVVDIYDLFEEIERECINMFPNRSILFDCRVTPKQNYIKADTVAIQEVLINMITDSIKFHPTNTPKITINISKSNKQFQVDYKDDGHGVPYNKKSEIFKPFYTTHSKGTGIGLADAKYVVESHGGNISETGTSGVLFQINFPITKTGEENEPRHKADQKRTDYRR